MAISFGGVLLLTPTRAVVDWVASAGISTAELLEFERPYWPGKNRQAWAFAVRRMPPSPLLGCLFWPTGATRFGTFWGLATDAELAQVRPLAYAAAKKWAPLPLVLSDGAGSITTSLYLLPPRPLAQCPVPPGSSGTQLYLLTLVDERYFWWERAADITVTPNVTTWAQLYAAAAAGLGISLAADPVSPSYLFPSDALTARYEALPLLLDAVAYNVGHRIVRGLDGTAKAQNYGNARKSQDQQYGSWPKEGGGTFLFQNPPQDLQGLAPASVTVAFAEVQNGQPNDHRYPVSVLLANLNLPEYPKVVAPGHTGTKVFRDSAAASFTSATVPGNATELTSLAQQIATDYYHWRLGRNAVAYAGVVPYTPEGLSDWVEWTLREGQCSTRVERPPWNDLVEDLLHGSSKGSVSQVAPNVYNYFNTFITDLTVNNLTVNNLTTLIENVVNEYVTNLVVNNSLTVTNIFNVPTFCWTTSPVEAISAGLQGWVFNPCSGQIVFVFGNNYWYGCLDCGTPGTGTPVPPPTSPPTPTPAPPGGGGGGGTPVTPCLPSGTATDCDYCTSGPFPETLCVTATMFGDDGSDPGLGGDTPCLGGADVLNGTFACVYQSGDVCLWYGDNLPIPCLGPPGGSESGVFQWIVRRVGSPGSAQWVVYLGLGGGALGGYAVYTNPTIDGDCTTFPVTLTLTGLPNFFGCVAYVPTTITLDVCPSPAPAGSGLPGSPENPCQPPGGAPEVPTPPPPSCCEDGGSLPLTVTLTYQYRVHNSGASWTTITPSIPLPYYALSNVWTTAAAAAVGTTAAKVLSADLECTAALPGGAGLPNVFQLTLLLQGTNGKKAGYTMVNPTCGSGGDPSCLTPCADGSLTFLNVDLSAAPVSGQFPQPVDGNFLGLTAGVLYDLRAVITW